MCSVGLKRRIMKILLSIHPMLAGFPIRTSRPAWDTFRSDEAKGESVPLPWP